MSYPLSSAVVPGDATAAAHYNNLRSDALYLGQAAADAVNLAALLADYESGLVLTYHFTDATKVKVDSGARIMIDGVMCTNPATVYLPTDQVPGGGAANYYVFAKRAAGSTTFTLVTKVGFLPDVNERLIGQFYWTGTAVKRDSVRTVLANSVTSLLYFREPHVFGGRLSSTNTTPVNKTDVSGAANLFYVPYSGSRVSLYVPGYGWRVYPFSVLTLNIAGCGAGLPHDIFLNVNSSGNLELSYLVWNTISARATDLTFQDGIRVLTGNPEYLYLGTFYPSAAGQYSDTFTQRLLWNHYNKVPRPFYAHDNTDSWTYLGAPMRKWNNADTTKLECVIGLMESLVYLEVAGLMEISNNTSMWFGIGIDSENVNSAQIVNGMNLLAATYNKQNYRSLYQGYLNSIGYHYFHPLEKASSTGTITVYGDYAMSLRSGIFGYVMG